MTGLVLPAALPLPGAAEGADRLIPLDRGGGKRAAWISRGLSVVLLIIIAVQLRDFDAQTLRAAIPDNKWFWPLLAAMYLALPAADFLIFRRLWGLGRAAIPVILRKRIANELLISYSGEAWFYLWARQQQGLRTIAFGAIKDVNILSAFAANLVTLAMLALAYPFVAEIDHGRYADMGLLSVAVVLGVSLLVLLFRRLLFTLPIRDLLWVSTVHIARLLISTALLAFVWHLALPVVPVGMWLMLAALRLVVTRLPMLPAKDVLFTSISLFLLGDHRDIASVLAGVTGLMLAAHLALGVLLSLIDFVDRKRGAAGMVQRPQTDEGAS